MRGKLFLSLMVLICLSNRTYSQFPNSQLAEDYVDNLKLELGLPGISTAIAIEGSVVFVSSKGFANVADNVQVSPKTVYPIASVSKVLTTTLMMSLVSERILDLDTPISRYIHYPISEELTLRHLATHTSGIRHYYYREDIEAYQQFDDLSDAVDIFLSDSLLFSPGTDFNYSSYGINVIGFVMESVTGKSFDELMSERVLKPLNMQNTFLRFPGDGIAASYNSGGEPIRLQNLRFNVAGGGMYSNVIDLTRFGQAILDKTIIDAGTSETMFTPGNLVDGSEIEYGIGWIVKELNNGSKIYYHSGHLDGAHSLLLLVPDLHLSMAMLSNRGSRFNAEEGLELICTFTTGTKDCLELPEEEQIDRELIMGHFQELSDTFENFQEWFNSGDVSSLNGILSPGFESEIWLNKQEFIEIIYQNDLSLEVFDVDISLRGFEEGDQAYISTMSFPELSNSRSFYMELTYNNGKWWITGLQEL